MKRVISVFLTAVLACALLLGGAAAETTKEEPGVTVYFPNWNIYSDARCDVKGLPWDRLDCVNHAFWEVVPRDGGFAVVSTDPWADTDPDNPVAHFPQYAECAEKYPDTKILISIGGWTDSGHFSEMALTAESRGSFIQSCLETLDTYSFLSGLDIDWEYPGVARDPEDESDEGNPVVGDDRTNYTLLLKELREALDEHFGAGKKIPTGWIITKDGKPTDDPEDYWRGAVMLPFAEHKGYGFATLVETMTGALAMSGMMSGVHSWNMQPGMDADTGHCFIVINPAFLGGQDAFRERIDAMIDELKRCPTVDGVEEVLYPGELEWRREASAIAEGIELPAASEKELARAAQMTGVEIKKG